MICALRVDERLIHGQVAMAWTRDLKIQGIVVANDEAAGNEMQKMTLKMAVPDGIKCIIKTVEEAIKLLNNPKAANMRILVLTRTVADALALYKAVPEIQYVNIGNAGRFTSGDGTSRTVLSRSVSLTEEELSCMKELVLLAPDTALQMVPTDDRKLVKDVLNSL